MRSCVTSSPLKFHVRHSASSFILEEYQERPRLSSRGGANQIDNRQLEIGNDFTLPPLRSNELLGGVAPTAFCPRCHRRSRSTTSRRVAIHASPRAPPAGAPAQPGTRDPPQTTERH